MSIDILAFAPHPDDAEICCGGLLLKAARRGQSTAVIDLTRGEMSSRGDLETRAQETAAASQKLELTVRENLNLPDAHLGSSQSDSEQTQLSAVVSAIRRHRPKLVLAPYWQARHPDHWEGSNLVTKAAFLANVAKFDQRTGEGRYAVSQVLYYQMRYQFRPSFIVDISDVVETQMAAVRCYQTQFGLKIEAHQGEQLSTLLTSPLHFSAVDARQRSYGAMIGVSHGEPYLTRNIVRVDDPLKHFTENPTDGTLFFPEQS
jgi:bacillithiol biosynthesis deacetylase BshB1